MQVRRRGGDLGKEEVGDEYYEDHCEGTIDEDLENRFNR